MSTRRCDGRFKPSGLRMKQIFISLVLADLNLESGLLRFAQAGHPTLFCNQLTTRSFT